MADKARELGNDLFKAGQFSDAIKHYNEAIKRNDLDAKNYSNRAACYMKLMAFPEAERDCETAIRIDPKFLKAYVRKAAIMYGKREYMQSIDICNETKEMDTEGKHTAELDGQVSNFINHRSQDVITH